MTAFAGIPFPTSLVDDLAAMATTVQQSTVQVLGRRGETGSGVIWRSDGVIVSNAHVVRGNTATIKLSDGQVLNARVMNRNSGRDLVALKIDATDLPAATISDSNQVETGQFVLAVGNPLEGMSAITTGIIHTLGAAQSPYRHWIQADIALAPGNSGGPLANAKGQVIGINTMIVDGRGFAIASNTVQQFMQHPGDCVYLGVTQQPVQVALQHRRRIGLLITAIEAHSPAATAQLLIGDVIIGVRGRFLQHLQELAQILAYSNAGDGLLLNVLRGDGLVEIEVVLCSRDSETEAA